MVVFLYMLCCLSIQPVCYTHNYIAHTHIAQHTHILFIYEHDICVYCVLYYILC
jgi:hypothetical protein